jgi:hypothetical protein
MSREDYDSVMKELEDSGCGEPDGRLFHAGYGDDEVHVFEVWETQEQFEDHHRTFVSVLQGSGVDAGNVEVHSLHSDRPD